MPTRRCAAMPPPFATIVPAMASPRPRDSQPDKTRVRLAAERADDKESEMKLTLTLLAGLTLLGTAGLVQASSSLDLNLGPDAVQFEATGDRKSTRLNSSHVRISYAVFCLKKKKNT